MSEDEIEKIRKMQNFLKAAWCVDGDCQSMGFAKVTMPNGEVHNWGMVYKLTDSKRGTFYVTMHKTDEAATQKVTQ